MKIDETNLEYEGSKYFGKVWLSNEEKMADKYERWISYFVLQLEISSLPEKYKNDLGGEGLVQFFFDVDWPAMMFDSHIFPNEHGAYHEQPLNSDAFNYLIEGKKPKQKVIKSWKSDKDLPNGEEEFSEELQSTVEALMENDKKMIKFEAFKVIS